MPVRSLFAAGFFASSSGNFPESQKVGGQISLALADKFPLHWQTNFPAICVSRHSGKLRKVKLER
jgi:hypothetical protein